MIAQELEENIQFAFRDARDRRLEYVTVEHLVLVLLDSREVTPMLRELGADRRGLRQDLEQFLENRVPPSITVAEPRPTPGFSRIIRRAISHAKENGIKHVTGVNVLASIHAEPESFASQFLDKRGISRMRISSWLKRSYETTVEVEKTVSDEDSLTVDLSKEVANGKLEEPYRREDIIDSILRVLCRKYKSNPLLVGEPGVGKTALVHSIAHIVAKGAVPDVLKNLAIHEVNVASLVAGTKYRGDFESRTKKLVSTMSSIPNSLLFIDEIHTIVGAGSVSGGALDAANILKPALVNGNLRCIGATTHSEYVRVFAKDAALARRFQKIEVPEPSCEEAERILASFKAPLEKHHNLTIDKEAVSAAVRLSNRYLPARYLPDKAIDLLDEAGAVAALEDGETKQITTVLLGKTVASISGMSVEAIERDEGSKLLQLEKDLGENIFGQDEALETLAHAVRRSKTGITDPNRPVGSFLFAGPTGVGKTEAAKILAKTLCVKLLRIDMSEYMESHSVSRLTGAPPGYVGFEQHGLLTEQVKRHPHCVLLLDEIEKAHPAVFNILLQVMDHGSLTDNSGERTDFRHATIIMTTNAGADSWEQPTVGFSDEEASGDELSAIKRLFTPEFRNRLSTIVRFAPLSRVIAAKVIKRELDKLAERLLTERGIKLHVSTKIHKLLLVEGFSKLYGARPLQRIISTRIMDAIALEEARKASVPGSQMSINCDSNGKVTVVRKVARKQKTKTKPAVVA